MIISQGSYTDIYLSISSYILGTSLYSVLYSYKLDLPLIISILDIPTQILFLIFSIHIQVLLLFFFEYSLSLCIYVPGVYIPVKLRDVFLQLLSWL